MVIVHNSQGYLDYLISILKGNIQCSAWHVLIPPQIWAGFCCSCCWGTPALSGWVNWIIYESFPFQVIMLATLLRASCLSLHLHVLLSLPFSLLLFSALSSLPALCPVPMRPSIFFSLFLGFCCIEFNSGVMKPFRNCFCLGPCKNAHAFWIFYYPVMTC